MKLRKAMCVMAKRKWRWVSRDDDARMVDIWGKHMKPKKFGSNYIDSNFIMVCHKEFERLFGITIKPGEAVKVEFTAKVVE